MIFSGSEGGLWECVRILTGWPFLGGVLQVLILQVPAAILSRSTAVVRGKTSIVSRPGNPRAIAGCLRALLPAVVEAIDRSAGFRQKTKP